MLKFCFVLALAVGIWVSQTQRQELMLYLVLSFYVLVLFVKTWETWKKHQQKQTKQKARRAKIENEIRKTMTDLGKTWKRKETKQGLKYQIIYMANFLAIIVISASVFYLFYQLVSSFMPPSKSQHQIAMEKATVKQKKLLAEMVYKCLSLARDQKISWLKEYAKRGEFPRNEDFKGKKIRYFVDRYQTTCAVAYLMVKSGYEDVVANVAKGNNHVIISQIENGPVMDWILSSGLTQEECVLIQPGYTHLHEQREIQELEESKRRFMEHFKKTREIFIKAQWRLRETNKDSVYLSKNFVKRSSLIEQQELERLKKHFSSTLKQLETNREKSLATAVERLIQVVR